MTVPHSIPTALCFDVEDLIAPESDDAVYWLAEILAEHGLTGSFMVVGEKARLWERRGRRDVIEALKQHHLSFHSTWHSVHPTTTEICLERNFAEGTEALWDWDRQGWADAERILGRPLLGWARTGSSWSPSVMGLMGQKGRGYAYSLVRLPGHNVCWYAGCLGFYGEGVGGFDATFYDDALFEERLAAVQRDVDRYAQSERRGAQWLCFFMCHPTRVISTEFWDAVNFAKGANPPREQWKPAPQHDASLIPTMQKNYRRLCEYLRRDDRLEIVGWGELIRRYDGQRPFATQADLEQIARRIADERQVLFTDFFTAGEILLMLCRAVAAPQGLYPRPAVYGPLTTPPVSPQKEWDAQAVKAAAAQVEEAARSGYLPASVSVGKEDIGLGTYFVALAEAFLGRDKVSGPAEAPYPPAAEAVAQDAARSIPGWVIHPANMDLSNLLEQTRLQCWALKPAWPRDVLFGQSA
ncbi:MAG TPA: hypothetical protein VFB38_14510 [Chthonomonadaceae bacterium]|nr:hypothetical protein [Chthonomonadaceae bacterium]